MGQKTKTKEITSN